MSLWGCDCPLPALAACHRRGKVCSRLSVFSPLFRARAKKALRKRENFRNSKTTNSLSHMEGYLFLGKTALDSMQMSSQGGLHWGTGDLSTFQSSQTLQIFHESIHLKAVYLGDRLRAPYPDDAAAPLN